MPKATDKEFSLYSLTEELLQAVNSLDLPRLRSMVDDDFGIVDVDPEGKTVVIDDMQEWQDYMHKNMLLMEQMKAELSFEINEYNEQVEENMAYVVVNFSQHVAFQGKQMRHDCISTVIWKKTENGWKEARWHCSRLPN
ncbi:MAG: YybH family protein [Cyclobacteriaceae bacterium]